MWAMGPHAPYTVTDATFEKVRDLSHGLNCRINLHLHETEGEVSGDLNGAELVAIECLLTLFTILNVALTMAVSVGDVLLRRHPWPFQAPV